MDNNSENKKIFESYPVPKALAKMIIPTVMGQLIVLIYNLADTFYIGRTNNPYMVAGASLILPVFNIALAISGLAGIGGGTLISRLLGSNREIEASKVSTFSIWLGISISATFSLLLFAFMNPFLELIGAGHNTIIYASQYAFCVIVLGGVPTVLSNVLANLIRSVGYSKQAGFGITMGGIINIVLDPFFMFLIFPSGMEIIGAGVATLLSNCIVCGYFIVNVNSMKDSIAFSFSFRNGLPTRESIRSVFSVGIPTSIATLLFDLDYMVIYRLMSIYGDIPVAAIGIVLKAERLPLNIGIGICQGMTPLVAYNYSAKKIPRMKRIILTAGAIGVFCSILSIICYVSFSPQIMRFFINESQTISIGIDFLRIRSIATIFMFLSFFTLHLFNGFGEGRQALMLGIMRWGAFNIPMQFILNGIIGMYGIVWSQCTADSINVIFSFIILERFLKRLDVADRNQ